MKISKEQRKKVRGDWEEIKFNGKIIPRYKVDKNFPKFEKMLQWINKEEVRKNLRKYSKIT